MCLAKDYVEWTLWNPENVSTLDVLWCILITLIIFWCCNKNGSLLLSSQERLTYLKYLFMGHQKVGDN